MAAEKATFKGFTFKRAASKSAVPGSTLPKGTSDRKTTPVSLPSGNKGSSSDIRITSAPLSSDRKAIPHLGKSISAPISSGSRSTPCDGKSPSALLSSGGRATSAPLSSGSKAACHDGEKKQPMSKSGSFQTSMTSFAKNKPVAVAAVKPQRALPPQVMKEDVSTTGLTRDLPVEIFDDDDDFETLPFSQSDHQSVVAAHRGERSPKRRRKEETSIPDVIPDTPDKDDPLDGVMPRKKKRRTLPIMESDEEQTPSRTSSQKNCSRDLEEKCEDICQHPLLKKGLNTVKPEEAVELMHILLRVVDEICDIFNKIPIKTLFDLLLDDFGRLGELLKVRKQIKDTMDLKKFQGKMRSNPALGRKSSPGHPLASTPLLSADKTELKRKKLALKKSPTKSPAVSSETPRSQVASFYDTSGGGDMVRGKNESINKNYYDDKRLSHRKPNERATTSFDSMNDKSLMCGQSNFRSSLGCNSSQSPVSRLNSSSRHSEMGGLKNSPSFQKNADIEEAYYDPHMEERGFDEEMEAALAFDESFEEADHLKKTDSSVSKKMNSPNKNSVEKNAPSLLSPGGSKVRQQAVVNDISSRSLDIRDVEDEKMLDSLVDEAAAGVNSYHIEDDEYYDGFKEDQERNSQQRFSDSTYIPVFSSSDHDDGASSEFAGFKFEHSTKLQDKFQEVFGLKEFRRNQLEAINAALLGHDIFVLMPTGGGKSLCYQLPAVVFEGVTVVVSPLKALIQDQTQQLLSRDIPVANLSGDTDGDSLVYSGLYQRKPAYRLIYVTPEKLSVSGKLLNCLGNLHRRQQLSRFVIDEAHCVSQWGHDFRPDYKKLNLLRERFPGVPTMALTATATPRVRRDIIHQLDMNNPKWFMQSFNRPNLKYSVQSKKCSNATTDVIQMIQSRFRNDCGIVYCFSRKECDNVAMDLRKAGLLANSYHAGLDDNKRATVQERWLNEDGCKIICATIAFGMGIDKADVRFVIHYSLPKSMEGYYQEAGRAGRDGMIAHCILFYTYSDVKRIRKLIELDQSATFDSKRVHIDNLFAMVGYCENVTDCRRCQLLQYFGECSFDRAMCASFAGAVCDNCHSKDSFNLRDVTQDAKEIVKCVRELNTPHGNYTLIHILEIFKGSQNSKIKSLGHSKLALHARGKDWTRNDAERLCRKLVIDRILKEDLQVTAMDHTVCYIRMGPRAADLMRNQIKIELPIQGKRKRADAVKIGTEPKNSREKIEQDCLTELRALAKTIATEHNFKNYALIFPESALKQLAQRTPITVEEMVDQIDHFNVTMVEKYKAQRFLEITLKYSMEMMEVETDANTAEEGSEEEWASHYFEETSSFSGASRGRGQRGRGGKRGFSKGRSSFKRGRGKGRKYPARGKAAAKKTAPSSFSQYKYNSGSSGSSGKATGNMATTGGPPQPRPTTVTKGTLGLMPDPRSRSFLSSHSKSGGSSFF
ncbi:Bloom syndrome protein homolog isoform X2 [Aplysia californica]|uniref:DNA 3'-5' helicase n=1 Tax=Aplysia californica TaxID=6500 RepID=A0ABM0JPG4_APLCA|nr:Bloom syndrome protein homolog isoform X1 [Aplysia californica]XP_005098479.1 Bloom syndrome protein homolog isoform X2 [Aplysia californica]